MPDNTNPAPEHLVLLDAKRVIVRENASSYEQVGQVLAIDYRPRVLVQLATGRRVWEAVDNVEAFPGDEDG